MTIAADYATATGAIDDLIDAINTALTGTEAEVTGTYDPAQRDLLADAGQRANEARAILNDIRHVSLVGQSL